MKVSGMANIPLTIIPLMLLASPRFSVFPRLMRTNERRRNRGLKFLKPNAVEFLRSHHGW